MNWEKVQFIDVCRWCVWRERRMDQH